jgi:hypothetical protein
MGTYKTDSSTNRSHGILKQPRTEVQFVRIMDHFVGRNIGRAVEHFNISESEYNPENVGNTVKFTKSENSFNCYGSFTVNSVGIISDYQFTRGNADNE